MSQTMKRNAILFLIFMGIISFLSDFTHEGARSIYGPFLGLIGASAFMVSFTSGFGELIGQTLRILTGWIVDKTKQYWTMMFIGYAINLLVIPLLMFVDASIWEVAIILILLERVGKGIRAPAKSALTSFVTPHLGAGKSFAIQEAMDQLGAFLGPLFVFIILNLNSGTELDGYQLAFGLLGIFAIMTIVMIYVSKVKYPHPDEFEKKTTVRSLKGNPTFVYYMIAVSFIALGFVDYPFLAYHINSTSSIDVIYVPLLYALAMGIDAFAAVFFGILFDKKGILSLIVAVVISIMITPVFFIVNGTIGILLGVILWGIGMGAQESILKAVISQLVSKDNRAFAYGIFYSVFGGAWFIGSALVGYLYQFNILFVVVFTVIAEVLAVVFLLIYQHQTKKVTTL